MVDKLLAQPAFVTLDVILEVNSPDILHHHVDGAVGPDKVQNVDDVGVFDTRQGIGFLEEQTTAMGEVFSCLVIERVNAAAVFAAVGEFSRHVFLYSHQIAGIHLPGQIDDTEPAASQLLVDDIIFQPGSRGKCGVCVVHAVPVGCRATRPLTFSMRSLGLPWTHHHNKSFAGSTHDSKYDSLCPPGGPGGVGGAAA